MRRVLFAAAALCLTTSVAQAEALPPVDDEIAKTECSDCHMAYPAVVLPKASWDKIMNNLSDHYGEDASLDDATVQHLIKYFGDNSNDVVRAKLMAEHEKVLEQKRAEGMSEKRLKMQRLPSHLRTASKWKSTGTPNRIQDVPRFIKKHSFGSNCMPVIEGLMKRSKVMSLGACSGCHANMPVNGSSAIIMRATLKMSPQDRAAYLTAQEEKCLDD